MWTCNQCGANVESTDMVCQKCGASQFESTSSTNTPSTETKPAIEKIPISSGVNGWATAYIVFAVIFFIAALCFWAAGADSYSKKAIYYDDALMYAGMGVGSLFMSSLIKGFGFVIRAAKLYLLQNGDKID